MTATGPADRALRRLARSFATLVALTLALMVLGALVRAHGAGLACPDWPLCFGDVVPAMDLRVAFEWSHRVVAGSVSLLFAAAAIASWRTPAARAAVGRLLLVAAALLLAQILLGAFTVWLRLAFWTVTAHLVTANAFAATLVVASTRLGDLAAGRTARPAPTAGARRALAVAALLLALQIVLGGLVSSNYAGLACTDWPACVAGRWFPGFGGALGLHLLHRWNAVLVIVALAVAARRLPAASRAARVTWAAAGIALVQGLVGIANVLLRLPVEVTGLHSALAALLMVGVVVALRDSVDAAGAAA